MLKQLQIRSLQSTATLLFPRISLRRSIPENNPEDPLETFQPRPSRYEKKDTDPELDAAFEKWYPGKMSKSRTSGVLSKEEYEEMLPEINQEFENAVLGKTRERKPKKPISSQNKLVREQSKLDLKEIQKEQRLEEFKKNMLYFDPNNPEIFVRFLKTRPPEEKSMVMQQNIKILSGHEKITMMNELLKALYTEESLLVYNTIYDNHIMPRLPYTDHHRLLFLLVSDPIKNKDEILRVHYRMTVEFNHKPARGVYTALIMCCKKWRNLDLALKLLQELEDKEMTPEFDSLNDIFWLCSIDSNLSTLNKAVSIWEKHKSNVDINLTTIKRMLEIFAHMKNVEGIQGVISIAKERRELLKREYNDKIRGAAKKSEATPYSLALNNSIMNAWIECNQLDKADNIKREMMSRNAINGKTMHLLLKMASKKNDLVFAEEVLQKSKTMDIRIDHIMHGRWIVLLGRNQKFKQAKVAFEKAVSDLSLAPHQEKFKSLQTSLMQAYFEAKQYHTVIRMYLEMKKEKKTPVILRSAFKYTIESYLHLGDLAASLDVLGHYNSTKNTHGNGAVDSEKLEFFTEDFLIKKFDEIQNSPVVTSN